MSTDTSLSGQGYLRNLSAPDKSPCGERACPALGCAAAPVKKIAVYQTLCRGWFWGCCAAQRGTSPLTTTALSAALSALSQRCVDTYGYRGQAPSHISTLRAAKICGTQPESTHLVVQPTPGHVQLPGGQADVAAGAFECGDDGVHFVAAQVLGGLRFVVAQRSARSGFQG